METVETNLLAEPTTQDIQEGATFKIVYAYQGVTNIIDVDLDIIEKGRQAIEHSIKSESFLIEAVQNFIRKMNFLELNESLEDGEISEEEFNIALEKDVNRYAITLKDIDNPNDALIIADLIKKIGYDLREFSTSEVSEMFSVKENQLVAMINSLRHQIK